MEKEHSFSIDLIRNVNNWGIEYVRTNGITFIGSSIAKIFCDKLAVLSSNSIINRPQDIYDLYRISHLEDLTTSELWKTLEEIGRSILDFSLFLEECETENGHLFLSYQNYADKYIIFKYF